MDMHLMGPGEIKQRIGPSLSRQRIYQLTQHPSFPKPLAELVRAARPVGVRAGDRLE